MTPTRATNAALRPYTPYVTAWSGEPEVPGEIVIRAHGLGVGYRDEVPVDRDSRGVLWHRDASRPGRGEPEFRTVHSLRQRRAMRDLLCQVCAGPADRTAEGVLWLLHDYREDWDGWPEGMGVTEPPICQPCARRAARLCPSLRARGAVTVRVGDAPLAGVNGALYRPAAPGSREAVAVAPVMLTDTDPRLPWIEAYHLVRKLHRCAFVDLDTGSGGDHTLTT